MSVDRRPGAGRDRLVLAPDQPGPGHPRGPGGGRHPRAGATGRQPSDLRPFGAALSGRASGRAADRAGAAPSQAAVALSGPRPARRERAGGDLAGDRPKAPERAARRAELVAAGAHRPGRGRRHPRQPLRPRDRARSSRPGRGGDRGGQAARWQAADGRIPRPARPARLGPGPAPEPVRLRLHLGGLCPGTEAPLGLLRPAAPVRRPDRRPDRATRGPGDRDTSGSSTCGGRTASDRSTSRGWSRPSRTRSRHTSRSPGCDGSPCRGPAVTATWRSG